MTQMAPTNHGVRGIYYLHGKNMDYVLSLTTQENQLTKECTSKCAKQSYKIFGKQ